MYETIKNISANDKEGVTPTIDVTGDADYEVIQNVLANGKIGATPVVVVGGGEANTDEYVLKSSVLPLIQQQYTVDAQILTTETQVPNISITVPKNGMYTATVRINVQKPQGNNLRVVTVRGKINNQIPIGSNLVRNVTVVDDDSIHYLEYTFSGNLTQNDILTLTIQSNGSGAFLVNELGVIGCQVELLKIVEI